MALFYRPFLEGVFFEDTPSGVAPAAFKELAGFGFFLSGARAAEFSPDTGASISVERASELQSSLNSRATLT